MIDSGRTTSLQTGMRVVCVASFSQSAAILGIPLDQQPQVGEVYTITRVGPACITANFMSVELKELSYRLHLPCMCGVNHPFWYDTRGFKPIKVVEHKQEAKQTVKV